MIRVLRLSNLLRTGVAGIAVLLFSMTSSATLISHNGYQSDTASDIVTGGGLEWLQWNVTAGQSIEDALGTYSAAGWRTASTIELAALLNDFSFGLTFNGYTNVTQSVSSPWTTSEVSTHNNFISLFGRTVPATDPVFEPSDPPAFSRAIVTGPFTPGGQTIFRASVRDDSYHPIGGNISHYVQFDSLFVELSYSNNNYGVALVREISSSEPDNVPEPGPLVLMCLGLLITGITVKSKLASKTVAI